MPRDAELASGGAGLLCVALGSVFTHSKAAGGQGEKVEASSTRKFQACAPQGGGCADNCLLAIQKEVNIKINIKFSS